ncbi:TetR/AcrR family transcriptional regulator [Streptacidiphilus rugosus]|uniref:TetR/AcrR family transcriptional regulator n=1 Tax=Streptacidiphilus rugosus TaxID=405783 RepID=UPI00056457D0|nr:TetR/AcrR family transcriptional regulator [Streptacidiphilus rugosus]
MAKPSSPTSTPVENPRRAQIRREAARLFAERGFLGVGVDEIGRAVGISGPGLYRHFAGKDAMLADLLVGISERLLGEGRSRVEAAAGPREALESLLQCHIDFALDESALITLHDRELLNLPDPERRRVRSLQRQYVELWVDVAGQVFPGLGAEARPAVHAVFGLLNSTPHSTPFASASAGVGGVVEAGQPPQAHPDGRAAMASLLHRLALGALAAAATAE